MKTMKIFKVAVSHPTGFHKGEHQIRVYIYTKTEYQQAHMTCDGEAFGSSRDYFVKTEKDAITSFLAEHACTIVKVTEVK